MVKSSYNTYCLDWINDLTIIALYKGERNLELIKLQNDMLNNVHGDKRVIEFKVTPKQKKKSSTPGRHFMWARFPGPEKKGVNRGLYALSEKGVPTRLLMESEIGLFNKADVFPCVVSSNIPFAHEKPSHGTKYADKPIWERIASIPNWSKCSPEFQQKALDGLEEMKKQAKKASTAKLCMTPIAPKNRVTAAKAKKNLSKPPTRVRNSRQSTVSGAMTPENDPSDPSSSPVSDFEDVAAIDNSFDSADLDMIGPPTCFGPEMEGPEDSIFFPPVRLPLGDDDSDNNTVASTSSKSSRFNAFEGTSEPLKEDNVDITKPFPFVASFKEHAANDFLSEDHSRPEPDHRYPDFFLKTTCGQSGGAHVEESRDENDPKDYSQEMQMSFTGLKL